MIHLTDTLFGLCSAKIYPLVLYADGTLLEKVSVQPSAAKDIVPWKYTVLKSTVQTARPRRLMTATVAVSANLMTRKAVTETVTRVVGSTHPGRRYELCWKSGDLFVCTDQMFVQVYLGLCMCLHLLMLKCLCCSAPRAAVEEPAVEGQCVERQLRLVAMRANAVKGTS